MRQLQNRERMNRQFHSSREKRVRHGKSDFLSSTISRRTPQDSDVAFSPSPRLQQNPNHPGLQQVKAQCGAVEHVGLKPRMRPRQASAATCAAFLSHRDSVSQSQDALPSLSVKVRPERPATTSGALDVSLNIFQAAEQLLGGRLS